MIKHCKRLEGLDEDGVHIVGTEVIANTVNISTGASICCRLWCKIAKDLVANPKCSLLVAKDPKDRTDLIITLHGDVSSHMNKDHAEDTKLIVQHSTSIPALDCGAALLKVDKLATGHNADDIAETDLLNILRVLQIFAEIIKDMTLITYYTGHVDYITNQEHDDCDSMMTLLLAKDPSNSLLIYPDKRGNIARFINGINNHTPEGRKKQNLKCARYSVNGECQVLLGERLYYDYNGYEHEYLTHHFVYDPRRYSSNEFA
ncbi:putative Histone-lysine N-methyltransferase ATXR5 [Camellia lanceoleosa]|uniref:Histone-lysine N-methyltransferase ATXR5 n=1 Tax=Camellia lanceoleosa TaxID=1840588 RepID=A0ACC0IU95_9ERIC|nr:putative Histone-lysine N-methyltransferase ATXR5 [Camellia lanceoleosa]